VIHRYHARLLHRLVFAGFSPERGGGARAPDVSDNALFKVQTMPDTRRTADASVLDTATPGPKGRGSLELWGPEPGSSFEPPGCASVVHPLRRRLSPWSTRRSPKPVEKGEGNCGAGDWGGGREGPKNLAVDDYRPEKTRVFLLHEIVRANFIPVFADAGSARQDNRFRRTRCSTLPNTLTGASRFVHPPVRSGWGIAARSSEAIALPGKTQTIVPLPQIR
jgi:hypothetical protein